MAHFHICVSESCVFLSLTYFLSFLLTPWSRILLERPIVFQQVKIFPAFYGTRMFVTAFTSAHHLSLSWATSMQSMPSHPTPWRSILLLYSYLRLGLPSGLFPSGLHTKPCIHSTSPVRATCSAHFILIDLVTRTMLVKECRCYVFLRSLLQDWHLHQSAILTYTNICVCSWLVSCVVMLLTRKGRSYYQVLTDGFNRKIGSNWTCFRL